MMLSGGLRWCSLNTFCLVQLLSLISLVCGLRTEHSSENQTVSTRDVYRAIFPASAWMPGIPGSGRGSFVGIGQIEATEGAQTSPHTEMETPPEKHSAGSHRASHLHRKPHDEPYPSAEDAEKKSSVIASWIEAPSDVHTEDSDDDETVLGKGETAQELPDELHRLTPREGLVALLSQGKDLVADVKGTLDGIDAVVSLGRVTQKIRDEIQKDVQALNRTIVEEFENIEQLRQLQEAQTAVLRSQLSFLMPKPAGSHGTETETAGHMEVASGETTIAALHSFWYVALLTAITLEIGASLVLK